MSMSDPIADMLTRIRNAQGVEKTVVSMPYGSLATFLRPTLTPAERTVAQVEGWILGVP